MTVWSSAWYRALSLHQRGLGLMDALHVAWAEYLKADVLVTVDDDFLRRSAQIRDIIVRIEDPVKLVRDLGI